jgi:hypothetical protein
MKIIAFEEHFKRKRYEASTAFVLAGSSE